MLEHLGLAVARDVVSHLKIAKRTCKGGRAEKSKCCSSLQKPTRVWLMIKKVHLEP